ncbi:hypothetical protein [Catellatospora citrea]|uniref:HEAT repeat protein n=1 Tax=Catellatospora citrea TaxID=53366 RepID=A0A8J3KLV6_9ACTN|nr:hypothetical protein [Catellatospora citrea]RKE05309.1 hypothetical protein C8E86_0104 [Catellatospora citrea]GIF98239.1 hypothetical protein Cci01nite_33330 [Catellatospora citrea]
MSDGPLAGLDAVAWHLLHHAYGPATDVPDQLRALRSPDPSRRAEALSRLFGNVYHQGTRWQASQAVVPFLVALADDPETPDRSTVVQLLRRIAVGDRRDDELPFDAQRTFAAGKALDGADHDEIIRRFHAEEEMADDEVEVLNAAAVRWAADSYVSAAARLATIVGWVSDPDDQVAAHAAALAAWFEPTAALVAALIAVTEHRARPRASANLALAYVPTADARIDRKLRELTGSSIGTVAITAAVASAYRDGGAISEPALSTLIEASERNDLEAVVGWDRHPRGFVMLALQRLGLG